MNKEPETIHPASGERIEPLQIMQYYYAHWGPAAQGWEKKGCESCGLQRIFRAAQEASRKKSSGRPNMIRRCNQCGSA
jgi:hypothetical protein